MDIHAKKSLGQNFLTTESIIDDIIRAADVTNNEHVLEVGPGKGILTKALLEKGALVTAIEKDARMVDYLQHNFSKEIADKKLILKEADILKEDPSLLFNNASYKLIANIPYYITGEIFRLFFETQATPSLMVLMVQKEVAERIVARDGKESILSLSVKAYGVPTYVKTVEAYHFNPAPNVDSAILKVDSISRAFFEQGVNEQRFFEIIKAGFAHKRKLLIRNLESVATKDAIAQAFSSAQIKTSARAEELSLNEWKQLIISLR